jgi:hypothetical protein
MKSLRVLLSVLALMFADRCFAEMREWTDSTGKFKIQGEFVEIKENVLILRNATGKNARIPLDKLSDEDRRYLEELTKAPAATTTATGPLTSMVRLVFNVAGADGQEREYVIPGFAIETTEENPVIVASRLALPSSLPPSAVDVGVAKAQILALRTDEVLGTGASVGYESKPEHAGQILATMLVLQTAPGTRVPLLKLAATPPVSGEEVTLAKLSPPRDRGANAPRPPIPWTKWTVQEGGDLKYFFNARPQDGQFPATGSLPILNAKGEVVGIMNPGVMVMQDKSRVAACLGLETLLSALDQSGIKLKASATMLSGDALPPMPSGPVDSAPWRTNYEAFVAGIKAEQSTDGKWVIDWGEAPDMGAWYEIARRSRVATLAYFQGGRRAPDARQQSQRIDALEAQMELAAKRLQGIEWVGVAKRITADSHASSQFDLPALPKPLGITFWVDERDVENWKKVKAGDRVRFACQFTSKTMSDYPSIDAIITLKEILPR